MSSHYWEKGACNGRPVYKLHFSEFYDDEVIATLTNDVEQENGWFYSIPLSNALEEYMFAVTLSEAKQQVEDIILESWEDEIYRLSECIFKLKKEIKKWDRD